LRVAPILSERADQVNPATRVRAAYHIVSAWSARTFPLDSFAQQQRLRMGGSGRRLAQVVSVARGCTMLRGDTENHSFPPERISWAIVGDTKITV
jgi:hypothetical protein